MVKLTCVLKRRAGMSPEEFHAYWRDHHGPLVASTRSGAHVIRYEQHHRPLSDYGARSSGSEFDGVTEQWFASIGEFLASIQEDDYKTVADDITRFLDTDSLMWVLTEEPDVIIDGEVT